VIIGILILGTLVSYQEIQGQSEESLPQSQTYLKLNDHEFTLPKTSLINQVTIDGWIDDYQRGTQIRIIIEQPDDAIHTQMVQGNNGNYSTTFDIKHDYPIGEYIIKTEYREKFVDMISFFVIDRITISTPASEISPKKQQDLGTLPEHVVCKEGLEKIFKFGDGSATCVKHETKLKLVERGWGLADKNMDPGFAQPTVSPENLGLPYKIEDLDLNHGDSHPYGIIRFSEDKLSHPGIDLQLVKGTEILAMGSGTIVLIENNPNSIDTKLILQIGKSEWGISYEHFVPDEKIVIGQLVPQGQLIGTFEDQLFVQHYLYNEGLHEFFHFIS